MKSYSGQIKELFKKKKSRKFYFDKVTKKNYLWRLGTYTDKKVQLVLQIIDSLNGIAYLS